jgi:fibro-slime domain-containing protein
MLWACSDDSNTSGEGNGGAGNGGTGGALLVDSGSGGSGAVGPWQLPPGFTTGEFGGYKLGEALDPNNPIPAPDAGTGAGGTSGASCGTTITGVVRDFQSSHPDFESYCCGSQKGLVQEQLGADQKPVYAPSGGTAFSTDAASFDQWYRTVPGVNLPFLVYISLEPNGGVYTFHSASFFPLDGQGFGNEGEPHNYWFTTEIHTRFRYGGGEVFRFTGDDDVFVFVNGRLVIDLGGVHGAQSQEVSLDAVAGQVGITPDNVYDLDLFHAERHTTESNFRIDTTLAFVDCGYVVPEQPR